MWLGKENEKEKLRLNFGNMRTVGERTIFASPVQSVNKLSAFYKTAAFIDVQREKEYRR